MIIIVEGPDGAGKSTLIEDMLKKLPNSRALHFGAPAKGEDQFLRYARQIINKRPDEILLFDRSWISEFVYGPIMRSRYELEIIHANILETLVVQGGGGMVIYLTTDLDTLWNRCQERGETYITSKKMLRDIRDEYEQAINDIPKLLPVIRVNTSR